LSHKTDHSSARKKLLIVGGTSSIAKLVTTSAIDEGYDVFCTFRNSEKITPLKDINWIPLDFAKVETIESTLSDLESIHLDYVIYLAGSLSHLQNEEAKLQSVEKYITESITLPVWFLTKLITRRTFKKNLQLTYVSSRSSDYGSHDYLYGIAKSSIENFIKSINLKKIPNLTLKIITSGLILGSEMEKSMPSEVSDNHFRSSEGKLLTLEQASVLIWNEATTNTTENVLEKVQIGPDY
jgi:short-subunit dehydrogenase